MRCARAQRPTDRLAGYYGPKKKRGPESPADHRGVTGYYEEAESLPLSDVSMQLMTVAAVSEQHVLREADVSFCFRRPGLSVHLR